MSTPPGPRRIERSASDRWLAGIAGGLAVHFGQPAWVFRLAFVVASVLGGAGVLAYALLWLFLPLQAAAPGARPRGGDLSGLLGLVSMGAGILITLAMLGAPVRVSLWLPLLLVGAGVVVLWRQGDEARGALVEQPPGSPAPSRTWDPGLWWRALAGVGLVVAGVIGLVGPRIDLVTSVQAIVATGAVVAGVVVIALPWLSTWARTRQAARYAAIRAEERAAMAARVHDSVLQTLTLIQRRADDPREVARLARAEERALRSWLYAPTGPSGTLAAALADAVAATEADYDVRIELVTVGDAVVDDRVEALVAATREALVNAAKHAQAPATVYAEVSGTEVEVNVKDRGVGYDPDGVPEDRHGVRESIVARVAAVGGRATVRTAAGSGTEVRLVLPREAQDA